MKPPASKTHSNHFKIGICTNYGGRCLIYKLVIFAKAREFVSQAKRI